MCRSLTYASIFLKNGSVIKIQDGSHLDRRYVCIETSGGGAKCVLLSQARRKRRSMENKWSHDLFSAHIKSLLEFPLSYRWFSLDVIAAMLVHRTIEKKSFGNLTLLLCKIRAIICYCFVHQHGRLITWLKTIYCGNVVAITKGASSPDPVAEKDVYISLLI